jgi:hypothetical protein
MTMKRSKHLGVYHNSDNDKPYRVAIKKYIHNKPSYTNVGYFDQEESAAWVYNVYALTTFGSGATVNKVDLTDEIEAEVETYADTRPGFVHLVTEATRLIEMHGDKIRVNQHGQ